MALLDEAEASIDAEHATKRAALIDGLRELADWLAAHPNVPVASYELAYDHSFDVYVDEKADIVPVLLATGQIEKKYRDDDVDLIRRFSGGVTYECSIRRSKVCQKVKVGERTVEAVPEHVEDVYEWKCEPLLGE